MREEIQIKPWDRTRYSLARGLGFGLFWGAVAATLFYLLEPLLESSLAKGPLIFVLFFVIFFIVYFLIGYFWYPRYLRRILAEEEARLKQRELEEMPFRCFKCEAVIQRTEDRCPQCGWTWK